MGADEIRDELLREYDVHLHDKQRLWSVGGDFGDDNFKKKSRTDYVRRGGGNLSEEDYRIVTKMVSERGKAKGVRDFDQADFIRQRLRDEYKVLIDDRSKEWHVDNDDYVRSPLVVAGEGKALTDEQVEEIQTKLATRAVHKRNGDYVTADGIRDELEEKYDLRVDDRTKEWKTGSDVEVEDEIEGNDDSEETVQIETEVAVETVTDTIVSADSEAAIEEEESTNDTMFSREDLMALTVPLLKEKLRSAGLPVSGRKADLVDRLL